MTSTSNSLDYKKLYAFCDPLSNRPFRLRDRDTSPPLTWEETRRISLGQKVVSPALEFDIASGKQTTDFLWSQSIHLVCISERLMALLTVNEITGWSTYPVEIFDRKGNPLPGYHGFAVTGPVCDLDRSRSEIVDKPPPTPQGQGYQVYRGLYFDESQWDGSDMFWVERADPVVTEKVFQLFKRNKISNVRFIRLDQDERQTA